MTRKKVPAKLSKWTSWLLCAALGSGILAEAAFKSLPRQVKSPNPRQMESKAAQEQAENAPPSLEWPTEETSKPAVPTVKEAAAPKPGFDFVPIDQRKALTERLRITAELVQKFGRAYDYRTHTTAQLRSILQFIQKEEGAELSPPPPPQLD